MKPQSNKKKVKELHISTQQINSINKKETTSINGYILGEKLDENGMGYWKSYDTKLKTNGVQLQTKNKTPLTSNINWSLYEKIIWNL